MRRVSLVALTLAGGAAIHGASAQGLSESTLTATISQSVEADTNYNLDADSPGTSYFGDTRIGLGLVQQSDTQRLRFGLNTGLRALDEAGGDFEVIAASPSTARLAFAQDFANNAFVIDLSARSRRIDRLTFEEDLFAEDGLPGDDLPILPDDVLPDDIALINDNTFEQRYDLDTSFTTGTNAPSTLGIRLRASEIDYSGDSPDDFTPRSAAEVELSWRLRLNPVLSGVALAGYRYEDADDDTATQLQVGEVDLGVNYQPSEEVSVTLGAGYADRRERQTDVDGDRTTEDDSGLSLRALADYQTEDFVFGLNARYTTAASSARLSGDARVSYRLPRSALNARVFQNFGLGSEGDDRQVTGAALGYNYTVNSLSGISLGLDAARSTSAEDEDGGDDDRSQVDFTAQYDRTVTETVTASLGYGLTQRFDDPDDAVSHRVFFQIGRSFVTRF